MEAACCLASLRFSREAMSTPWSWSPTLANASSKPSQRTRLMKYLSKLDLWKARCSLQPFSHWA
eukprot:1591474-Alexandrium_andersonii.AAC.1